MKEGRIFLYVSPNVLLPLMFVILMLTSLAVHFSILTNTTWFSAFWQGSAAEVAAAPAVEPAVEAPAMMAEEPAAPAAEEAAPEAAPAAEEAAPAQ